MVFGGLVKKLRKEPVSFAGIIVSIICAGIGLLRPTYVNVGSGAFSVFGIGGSVNAWLSLGAVIFVVSLLYRQLKG